MIDREKVIKGIDICLQRFHCGEDCPYYNDEKIGCEEQLREDALALLKDQQQQIWELQDQVEYLTDKQKEQDEEVRAAYRRGLESGRTIKWD